MTRRSSFDGRRQAAALRGLLVRKGQRYFTRSGRTLTQIAGALGMGYGTLWKYVDGRTPLCSHHFGMFAAAFETTEDELLRACFPVLTGGAEAGGWDARAELDRAGFTENEIQQVLADIAEMRPQTQRQAVRLVIMARALEAQVEKDREATA